MPCRKISQLTYSLVFFTPRSSKHKLTKISKFPRVGRNQFKIRAVASPSLFLCSLTARSLRELVHGPKLEETHSVERVKTVKSISPVMCQNWSTGVSDELQQQYTGHGHPAQVGYTGIAGKNGTVALAFPQPLPHQCSAPETASKDQDFKQSHPKTTQLFNICHCDWICGVKPPRILKTTKHDD